MISTSAPAKPGLLSFRIKLLVAMMLIVSGITASGLYLAQRQLAATTEQELEREFQGEVASWHRVQEMHQAAPERPAFTEASISASGSIRTD